MSQLLFCHECKPAFIKSHLSKDSQFMLLYHETKGLISQYLQLGDAAFVKWANFHWPVVISVSC